MGVIQPIILAPNGKRYTIVAGERRWRAARMAELSEVPAIVRDVEEIRRMEMSLIENIQRTDLNPMEEAQAIHALMQQCGLTQEQVAQRLGKSRSAVANLLRLLSLPQEVADLVASGDLTEGHARALLGAENERDIVNLSRQVVQRGLNVRQTESLVKYMREETAPKPERPRCAELALVEEAAASASARRSPSPATPGTERSSCTTAPRRTSTASMNSCAFGKIERAALRVHVKHAALF